MRIFSNTLATIILSTLLVTQTFAEVRSSDQLARAIDSLLASGEQSETQTIAQNKRSNEPYNRNSMHIYYADISRDQTAGVCLYGVFLQGHTGALRLARHTGSDLAYIKNQIGQIYMNGSEKQTISLSVLDDSNFLVAYVNPNRKLMVRQITFDPTIKGAQEIISTTLSTPPNLSNKLIKKLCSFPTADKGVGIALQTTSNEVYALHYKQTSALQSTKLISSNARLVGGGIQKNANGSYVITEEDSRLRLYGRNKSTANYTPTKYITAQGVQVASNTSIMRVSSANKACVIYKKRNGPISVIVDVLADPPETEDFPSEVTEALNIEMNGVNDIMAFVNTNSETDIYVRRSGSSLQIAQETDSSANPRLSAYTFQITEESKISRSATVFQIWEQIDLTNSTKNYNVRVSPDSTIIRSDSTPISSYKANPTGTYFHAGTIQNQDKGCLGFRLTWRAQVPLVNSIGEPISDHGTTVLEERQSLMFIFGDLQPNSS